MGIMVYYNKKEDIYFLDPISKNKYFNNQLSILFNNYVISKEYEFLYSIFIPLNYLLRLYSKDPDSFPYCFHMWFNLMNNREED